jgi:hypothetical protein
MHADVSITPPSTTPHGGPMIVANVPPPICFVVVSVAMIRMRSLLPATENEATEQPDATTSGSIIVPHRLSVSELASKGDSATWMIGLAMLAAFRP